MFENNLICRLCLTDSKTNNTSIFNTVSESVSLSEKVMVLANVQIFEGDGLSNKICSTCISKVESFFAFKQQVENSDLILRQQLTHQSFVQVNCSNNKNINVIYIKEEIEEEDSFEEGCDQSWSSEMDDYQNLNLKDEEDDTYKEVNTIETDIRSSKILNGTEDTESESQSLTFYSGIAYFHNNTKYKPTKFKLRKKKKLTLENKIQVIEQSKQGKSQRALAALFSCSKTQIQHILANKERFNSEWQENGDKNCQFAKQKRENIVNEMVWGWIQQMRTEGRVITGQMIKDKGKELSEIANINHFSADNYWLESFRKSYKFSFKFLSTTETVLLRI